MTKKHIVKLMVVLALIFLTVIPRCSKNKPTKSSTEEKQPKKTEKIQVVTNDTGKAIIKSINFGDIEISVKGESGHPIVGAKIVFLYTGKDYTNNTPEYVMLTAFAPDDSLSPVFKLITIDSLNAGRVNKVALPWKEFILAAWDIYNGVIAGHQIYTHRDIPTQDFSWINLFPWVKYVGRGTFDQYKNHWNTRFTIFGIVSSVGGPLTSVSGTVISMAGSKMMDDYDNFCKTVNSVGWPVCYEPGIKYDWYELYYPDLFPGSNILPKCIFIIGIEVPNNPPHTASNPSPSHQAVDQSINVDLSWTGGDPDGDPVTYDVYFGTISSPPIAVTGHTNTTYNHGALTYDTKYYWKIVSKDNRGGETTGPVWNFTTTIKESDTTPPEAITDLGTSNPTQNSITLTWTAPGDDDNSGTASQYDIRYSTSNIIESDWGSATQCTGEQAPKSAGSPESFVVTGLNSNTTTYHFGVKTADEVPNWSGLSNVASGTTEPLLSDGEITFGSDRDGHSQIYLMNVDGSGQYNISNTTYEDGWPAWSPDGKKIAFCRYEETSQGDIWIMSNDGTDKQKLVGGDEHDVCPTWSPDGSKIAFVRRGYDKGCIFIINIDGSGLHSISPSDAIDDCPSWSPDGKKITFSSFVEGNEDIFVMNADGSNRNNKTNSPSRDDYEPSWSPDGSKIAFVSISFYDNPGYNIFVMNSDGSNQQALTTTGYSWTPDWSPDGTKIVYAYHGEIFVMNADGTNHTNISNNPAIDFCPRWKR